jgi:hypothetical protein
LDGQVKRAGWLAGSLVAAVAIVAAAWGIWSARQRGGLLIPIPDTEDSLVLRTDYSDDTAWEKLAAAIRAPVGEFRAHVTFISEPKCRGLDVRRVIEQLPDDFGRSFIFIVDETAIRFPEHPVLVVDLHEQPGRTFRVIPSAMWAVENNLSLANLDFNEFADNVGADGIFRGL